MATDSAASRVYPARPAGPGGHPSDCTDRAGLATQRVAAGNNAGVSSIVATDAGGIERVAFTITVSQPLD